ncbi:MAG: hypothetical protein MSA04_05860 [Clostridiales bacterium]|nr:hypothetical protein [Clostridiales bacterium]
MQAQRNNSHWDVVFPICLSTVAHCFQESGFWQSDPDETFFPIYQYTLEDLRLLQAIKTLSIEELEILTFLTLEEHSQKELAERWGCSQRAISKKFQKIKKIFQKWF